MEATSTIPSHPGGAYHFCWHPVPLIFLFYKTIEAKEKGIEDNIVDQGSHSGISLHFKVKTSLAFYLSFYFHLGFSFPGHVCLFFCPSFHQSITSQCCTSFIGERKFGNGCTGSGRNRSFSFIGITRIDAVRIVSTGWACIRHNSALTFLSVGHCVWNYFNVAFIFRK